MVSYSILTFTLSPYPSLSKPPLFLSHELFLYTALLFPSSYCTSKGKTGENTAHCLTGSEATHIIQP